MPALWGCDPPTDQNDPKKDSLTAQQRLDSIVTATQTNELRSSVLCDLVRNVVLPVVDEFDAQAGALRFSIKALSEQRTDANLQAARQAWRDTRGPWETCEAFLFGPAKTQGLDPAVDSWPIDLITIDSMLASNDRFTPAYFDVSEGTVKGSHAIELLLWGSNGAKRVDEITPREIEFLVAASESMQSAASALKRAWIPPVSSGETGYGEQVCNAGQPGSLYTTRAGAVREFVNGLISILTEVSDSKMGIPFLQQNVDFEEARFSGNSKDDFKANLAGVRSIYTGTYGPRSGKGLRDLVMATDTALAAKVQRSIDNVEARLDAINPSFTEAVLHSRNVVQTARFAMTDLAATLSTEVTEKILPR
jgi:predicted lipoprotein